jgi:hypothetical protein
MNMYRNKIVERYLGWCPNAPALRTAPAILSTPMDSVHPLEPDGRTRGSGRIDRGIILAAGSIKILNRNKQLLWFSFLTGLVMLFMFTAEYSLHVFGMYPYPPIEYSLWLALTFTIQMISILCINFLLAGLILSVSSGFSGRPVTLREGMTNTRNHIRSLFGWSFVMALVGTALFVLMIRNFGDFNFTLIRILDQFPFNFILLPEIYSYGPIGGGFHIASSLTATFYAVTINVIFFILTLFVVPLLVLENIRMNTAIGESISLMKKSWGEIITCLLIFGLILLVISLASVLFRITYGVVSPDNLLSWYPGQGWIAGAALFMLVWYILAVIISTVGGISLFCLYTFAKTGRMPGAFLRVEGMGR